DWSSDVCSADLEVVRSMVALHPRTSPDTLRTMLKDKETAVRLQALRNPNLPADAADDLLRATEKRQVGAVSAGRGDPGSIARQRLTSPRLLALLATKAPDEVATNPRALLEDLIPLPKVPKRDRPAKLAARGKPAPS